MSINTSPVPAQPLFFSIVLPTYNRPQQLANALQSIADLDYPPSDYEVIVVDDGGTTDLRELIEPFFPRLNLTLHRQENRGPAAARNAGAALAKGDFLVFLDDDCAPTQNWLEALKVRLLKAPEALIGGYTKNILSRNIYAIASQLLIDYIYAYYNEAETASRQTQFFTSNNLAIKADRLRQFGGFDTTFPLAAGEDREFCDRWLQQGNTMVYAKEAVVHHSHNLTLSDFWRQHFNYGRGAIWFNQSRTKRGLGPIKPEPKEFYTDLFRYPYKRGFSYRAPFIALLFFLSQFAHSAGCFWERKYPLTKKPSQA